MAQSTFSNLPARVHAGCRMAAIARYRESAGSKWDMRKVG